MRINLKWQVGLTLTLAALFLAGGVSAQVDPQSVAKLEDISQTLAQVVRAGGRGGSVGFGTGIAASFNKTVTGAPYSARIWTKSVQPFADGNAITDETVSSVWRDSQGRTRREEIINMIGPSQASRSAIQFITIDDPVAGVHYTLNPNKMTATQFTVSGSTSAMSVAVLPTITTGGDVSFSIGGDGAFSAAGGRGDSMSTTQLKASPDNNVTTESLGADTMEGLSVLGTRVTRTIPAGQIRNVKPILIITDKWYSQDLQIDMKTVHSDPRTGTTTTTVTNLSRNEPSPSLFTVPPGYTITTPGSGTNKVVLKQQEPL